MARLARGETAVLSSIRYRSKAHRDRVVAKVMQDPRMSRLMQAGPPFDPGRMGHGGFAPLVGLPAARRA